MIIPAVTPVRALPIGRPNVVMRFPCEKPNLYAAINPPIIPVKQPMTGPPKRAAIKVVICERSRAREILIPPKGMEGIIGVTNMDKADRTLPKALIMAMKTILFEDLNVELINLLHPYNIYQ